MRRFLWAIFVLALLCPIRSGAYEADVHYGLTYWLARKVGFEPAEAQQIARGNQRTDLGWISATHMILLSVCAGIGENIEDASRDVRDRHFRSDAVVPNHPKDRPVQAASKYAVQEISDRVSERPDSDDLLYRFGRALHGMQDSFSHQGQASTVLLCPDQWVWSHSSARGGPASHRPDWTHEYPKDAINMARKTYEYLLEFKKHRQKKYPAEARWESLEAEVTRFVGTKTKTEKERWLEAGGIPLAREIAAETNLPAGENGFTQYLGIRLNLSGPSPGTADAKNQQVRQIVQKQLDEILSKNSATAAAIQGIEGFLQAWLGQREIGAQLLAAKLTINGQPVKPAQFRRVLHALTLADHGAAAESRHGLDDLSTSLPTLPRSVDWRKMLTRGFPGNANRQFLALRPDAKSTADNRAVAILRLAHASHDLVLLTVERVSATWVVTDLTIVVVH